MLEQAVERLLAAADRERGGFGGAPKFPPASALELLLAHGPAAETRASTAVVERTLDAMMAGRHLRPARRRLRPLLGRRRLARPPLREDALRQRAARPRLPARLAGARPRALPPRLRGDARLDAARDARPRGRLLLGPRRRLRGRGGPLLRLDPGARSREACCGDATPTPAIVATTASPSAATSRAPTSSTSPGGAGARRRPSGLEEARAGALRGARRAGLARPRRQAAHLLERAGDRRPGRGRRGARPRGLPRRRARAAPTSCSTRCATRDGPAAAHLQGRRRPPQRLPRGPRLPARGAADPLRSDLRAALVRARRGSSPRR